MSEWIVETLVASTLLMALVMILRRPIATRIGGRIAYLLWALPALRMVLPPLPESWGWRQLYVPVATMTPAPDGGSAKVTLGLVDPVHAQELVVATHNAPPMTGRVAESFLATTDWTTVALTVWLAGAVVWFAANMFAYHRFIRRVMAGSRLLSRECGIDVIVTPGVDGPMAAGIFKRRIFLPADFVTRYTSEERRLAVMHEAAHHDRRDLIANVTALGMLSLHWWNPIAHRAYRAFRVDQELACDATVLEGASPDHRYAYGSAVVKAACKRAPAAACALNNKDQLKRRLRMMGKEQTRGTLAMAAKLGVATLVGIGLGVTASVAASSGTAPEIRKIALPATPEMPASPVRPQHIAAPTEIAGVVRTTDVPTALPGHVPPAPVAPIPPIAPIAPIAPPARLSSDLRDADAERREALAEAAADRREALAEAAAARREAHAEADAARAEANAERLGAMTEQRAAEQAIRSTRISMATACARQGKPISANSGWDKLALCGDQKALILTSLRTARASLDRRSFDHALDEARRELDREIARLESGNGDD